MRSHDPAQTAPQYSVIAPKAHFLHECRDPEEFNNGFQSATGCSVSEVIDQVVAPGAPRAIFLTGSLPLGMATNGSDVDFVTLVDSKEALRPLDERSRTNTSQRLTFVSDSDPLRVGLFICVMNGITVEVAAVVTSSIRQIYTRLRSKGPELSEGEIMTLGRLSTGWLLWQSEAYLERSGIKLSDPALNIYCSTKNFTYARIYGLKSTRALDLGDIPQALYLGRESVEMAYLGYFASEGMPYLGAKWLAQVGHARGAAERVSRYPLLKEGIPLLFPACHSSPQEVRAYLKEAAEFVERMKALIGRRTLYRIAFEACPQA